MLTRTALRSRSSTGVSHSFVSSLTQQPSRHTGQQIIPRRSVCYSKPTMATNGNAQALHTDKIEQEAHRLSNGTDTKVNNWATPGPAAFDFRSMVLPAPPSFPSTPC